MKQIRTVSLLLLIILLISACGRRLSDEEIAELRQQVRPTEVAAVAEPVETEPEVTQADTEAPVEETAEEVTTENETPAVAEETSAEAVEVAAAEPVDPFTQAILDADAAHGEVLFGEMNSAGLACSNCHLVDSDAMLVGPGMWNLTQRVSTERNVDEDPLQYIYNSITHPNDYVVDGYPANVMPAVYLDIYSEQDLYDLVAYINTLSDAPIEPVQEPVVASAPAVEETSSEPVAEDAAETETTTESEVAEVAQASDNDASESTQERVVIVVTATPTPDTSLSAADFDYSGTPDPVVTIAALGRVSQGEAIFEMACATCHGIAEGSELAIAGVNTRAVQQYMSPERYIYESIINENVHPGLAAELSTSQLYDVLAYTQAVGN